MYAMNNVLFAMYTLWPVWAFFTVMLAALIAEEVYRMHINHKAQRQRAMSNNDWQRLRRYLNTKQH